jgi:hypothetical protein
MTSIQQSALSTQPSRFTAKDAKSAKEEQLAIGNWQLAFVSSFYAFV